MRNPFQYGSVVRGEAFCNRQQERRDLRRAIENGEKLFLYSERRLGKTSLVRSVLEELPDEEFVGAYVDLWATDDEAGFIRQTAAAIARSLASTPERMLKAARQFFSRLSPGVSVDDEGNPRISFGVGEKTEPLLEEVLEIPKRVAERGRKRVVVVYDECQRILEYGDDLVERKLRSTIQHHDDVCYLFLGSRKHVIQSMFLDQSRPLYRAAGHYPLGTIDAEHWIPYIRRRFEDAARGIDEETVRSLCTLTEGHPFYTQHLCHALWEQCVPGETVTSSGIMKALDTLLARESYAYSTLWDSLSVNQRRFLTGIATGEAPVEPFSTRFVTRFGLGSASNAQRASEALLTRDILDREDGEFVIVDRFLKLWVRKISDSAARS